ncbi:hypothetical protein LGN04_26515 [Burkholderia multivorans]|nr:hypothetical protein [Burkholderia multivorans]
MMDEKQRLVEYLMTKTGGPQLMTPKQLEKEIGISAKQQSKLREEGKFPIPHTNIGRSVYYSVHHVADFLLSGEGQVPPTSPAVAQQPANETQAVKTKPVKRHREPQDFSQALLNIRFVSVLEEQRENLDHLINHFTKLVKSKTLHDELQGSLAAKEPVKNKTTLKI